MRDVQAGLLKNFTERDYGAAFSGLGRLIEALTKTAKTMNPQDEGRQKIESAADEMNRLKTQLMQMPECQEALVIFLTALYQDTDTNDKDLFIAKPVQPEKIVQFIDEHLRMEEG